MNIVEIIDNDLNHACDLTQQIIDQADKSEFDHIDALNQNRLVLIDKIFNNEKANINKDLAQKLLKLNEQATNALKQQMALNIQQQKKIRKGNAAHSAYMSHSR